MTERIRGDELIVALMVEATGNLAELRALALLADAGWLADGSPVLRAVRRHPRAAVEWGIVRLAAVAGALGDDDSAYLEAIAVVAAGRATTCPHDLVRRMRPPDAERIAEVFQGLSRTASERMSQ